MTMDEETFGRRVDRHYEKVQEYIGVLASARTTFPYMSKAYEEAVQAIVASGAVRIDRKGNITAGWYDFGDLDPERFSDGSATGAGMAEGAASIVAAIGAPAAAWTLVGVFGAASTGAAISGLSGAAATSATAAWFGGGSVAAGGLGMAAAPFALTGIGAVAGLGVLGAAAAVRHISNRRNRDERIKRNNRVMDVAEKRMKANQEWLLKHQETAYRITKQLIKTTAILEYLSGKSKSDKSVSDIDRMLIQAQDLFREMRDSPIPHVTLYLKIPSQVTDLIRTSSTRNSIYIEWKDPDNGESEITHYKMEWWEGLLRDNTLLCTADPKTKIHQLAPGSNYSIAITAVNEIGEGEESDDFKVRTTP